MIAVRTTVNSMLVVDKTSEGRVRLTDHVWHKSTRFQSSMERWYELRVYPDPLRLSNPLPPRTAKFRTREHLMENLSARFRGEVKSW